MTDDNLTEAELAYAQARAYGKDLARLYAVEKKRRKELETTTQKLQAIFDTVPNGLAVVDNNLKVMEVNPRFLLMFHQTTACIGRSLAELLPVEALQETMETVQQQGTELGNVEMETTQPVNRTLLVNLSPLSEDQGWVLILHDLTERKRLEGLKDEFVNIAAHELRTPLAGVMGFVGVLQEELKHLDDPMMSNLAELILQSTERLRTTIDELVDFVAATERNADQNLHIADIDLGRLMRKLLDLLQPQIEAKGLEYELLLPGDDIVMVRGDQFILSEVIYQLLHNAIIFNRSNGKIVVRVEQLLPASTDLENSDSKTTLIEIEDSGIGIPQTDLDRIFDKFYQVEEHLTRGIGGLGLGLSIARHGVERHGGQLSVISHLGQGSTFRLVLPSISQLSSVSIDNRVDVAHQQMLTYAKDMAQAIASQRRMTKRMARIQSLSRQLVDTLASGAEAVDTTTLDQAQAIGQELIQLSQQDAE